MHELSVIEVQSVDKGNLKAFVAVQVNGVLVKDCRIIQPPGQAAWVSAPQVSYEVGGEKKWKSLVEFPKEMRKQIEAVVLEAWQGEPDSRLTTKPKFDEVEISAPDPPVRRRSPVREFSSI
jgi:hypothetical protein